jgi:DNA ligase 1
MITKPLLADKTLCEEDSAQYYAKLTFPKAATPKIDGIRCIKPKDNAVSRSFKPIPNVHIREMIEKNVVAGVDGELEINGGTFNDAQSQVMTRAGTPDFRYRIFDYVKDSLEKGYMERMADLRAMFDANPQILTFCEPVYPVIVNNLEELEAVKKLHLSQGYEGTMLRNLDSKYKCGRSSFKENILLAIKYFVDGEAEILSVEEKMHNANEATEDAFGNTERSSHKANMIPAGTLGKFVVRNLKDNTQFKIGTFKNLTDEKKLDIWNNKDSYVGKVVHFREQLHGKKDKPRIPSFYGFRSLEDMGE